MCLKGGGKHMTKEIGAWGYIGRGRPDKQRYVPKRIPVRYVPGPHAEGQLASRERTPEHSGITDSEEIIVSREERPEIIDERPR